MFVGSNFNKEDFLNDYPDYHKNYKLLNKFVEKYVNMSYADKIKNLQSYFDKLNPEKEQEMEELSNLKKYFVKLQYDYLTAAGMKTIIDSGVCRMEIIFDSEIEYLNKIIDELSYPLCSVHFFENKVHGYNIEPYLKIKIHYDEFIELRKIWENSKDLSFEEFEKIFDDTACNEWSKNAYMLSREENCKALYDLPYPKEFILETINIGCSNRLECISFSAYLCEYMKKILDKNRLHY
ncbi:MAG: hypothetical protein Satyrvirus7_10 [Satyrvirus sp.]|uniref:Uncharacterized protein n=1 Tax=Satyrvirus sp. TaxID=2487771 RepID=A0A3G5ADB9_9VIRU|nr:MAG: hypothetical protein Satyrvirus7_10 [Satyrvirus sp.]